MEGVLVFEGGVEGLVEEDLVNNDKGNGYCVDVVMYYLRRGIGGVGGSWLN